MRSTRAWLRSALVGAAVAVAAFAVFGAMSPPASSATARPQVATTTSTRQMEVEMIGRINAQRAGAHLPPLREDRPDLTVMARTWAASMAKDGGISHRTDLTTASPADWVKVGENVGVGGSIASLHDAFVASPLHHKNLVDPDFESVGVGVVVVGGRIWIAENFMKAAPAGTTPVADSVHLAAPPGGLGHKTCVTLACYQATSGGRRIAFTRL